MKFVWTVSRLMVGMIILSGSSTLLAAKPKVYNFTLENGIRVVSICIPDSDNVSIFAYLPMGLAGDGPGQTQWSHLIEHLVIRTPEPLPYDRANAETLPDHMRLDFYGTVDNWKAGLSHHAGWLKGVAFTQQKLRAEKPRVTSECDAVAKRLATHKFAIAAWAQGFRHGRKHVALKDEVDKAGLAEIQKYRDSRLAVLDRTVICVVGGISPQILEPIINERFGTIQSKARVAKPAKEHPGDHKMTWDIDARHVILSWPIPDVVHPQYGALMVAARLLMVRFNLDAEFKTLTGMVLAGTDLVVPEGRFFYVTASLRPEASFDDVQKKLEQHIAALKSKEEAVAWAAMIGQQMCLEIGQVMDPALAKAQLPANVSAAMAEAQSGLLWGTHEFRYGAHQGALAKRLTAVTGKKVRRAVAEYTAKDKGSVICIEPKVEASEK